MSERRRRAEHLTATVVREVERQFHAYGWERSHLMGLIVVRSVFEAVLILAMKFGVSMREVSHFVETAGRDFLAKLDHAKRSLTREPREPRGYEFEERPPVQFGAREIDFLNSVRGLDPLGDDDDRT